MSYHRSAAFRERVRAYRRAFEGAEPTAWWARLGARMGLRRVLAFVLADATWLSIVLADLERFCHARPDQTTFIDDDANGRLSAYAEGLRQAYLRLKGSLELTGAEELRMTDLLDEEENQDHAA